MCVVVDNVCFLGGVCASRGGTDATRERRGSESGCPMHAASESLPMAAEPGSESGV